MLLLLYSISLVKSNLHWILWMNLHWRPFSCQIGFERSRGLLQTKPAKVWSSKVLPVRMVDCWMVWISNWRSSKYKSASSPKLIACMIHYTYIWLCFIFAARSSHRSARSLHSLLLGRPVLQLRISISSCLLHPLLHPYQKPQYYEYKDKSKIEKRTKVKEIKCPPSYVSITEAVV